MITQKQKVLKKFYLVKEDYYKVSYQKHIKLGKIVIKSALLKDLIGQRVKVYIYRNRVLHLKIKRQI